MRHGDLLEISQASDGAWVVLVAVAFSTATFVGWAGACDGTGACDLTLDSNREVSATFAFVPPPLPSDAIVQGRPLRLSAHD
jgi:Divergent InlB B-repeat domain